MRAYLPAYALRAPANVAEALETLASEPGRWRPFAGGTDLMVQLESGALPEGRYLGLWKLSELRGIREDDGAVVIGALTTYADALGNPLLREEYPLMCEAARETGGVATQNRGTIGGNIANASPAADTPPALIVYDAELELISVRGVRRVSYDAFHLGYKKMDLAPDELIARVRLPKRASRWFERFRKVGTRRAQAISKVCLAAALQLDVKSALVSDARIAFGSVAPTVVRAVAAESALRGQPLDQSSIRAAVDALALDIAPIDDIRSTARYRLSVGRRILREWLEGLARP
jgi:CO/xanthine dehydrogenase FAD-binding subunit